MKTLTNREWDNNNMIHMILLYVWIAERSFESNRIRSEYSINFNFNYIIGECTAQMPIRKTHMIHLQTSYDSVVLSKDNGVIRINLKVFLQEQK